VGPRFGRLYSAAVLRPFAEQLTDELGVRASETACDLLCDAGTLAVALGAAVGTHGRLVLADTDAELLTGAAHDVAASGCAVATSVIADRAAAIADASCDRVGSLCTLGFWDGADLLDETERILKPSGVAALLSWDGGDPPAHERALVDALRDEAGIRSPFLERCLPAGVAGSRAHWETLTLRDVVRFDGMAQYWTAMVLERPIVAELAGKSVSLLEAVRGACERALRPCIAADGTMRIPVTATMLRRRAGRDRY
jgi:SAM-dependent methyltransferase